jgi:hypothetical protein
VLPPKTKSLSSRVRELKMRASRRGNSRAAESSSVRAR